MSDKFDYAKFYCEQYEAFVHYAQRYISEEEDARDVVSEAFLRLMEIEERLEPGLNVKALFFSIVRNKCLDYVRRLQCYSGVELRLKQTADRLADDELEALCHREMFAIVAQTISEMPQLQKDVLREIRFEGMSYKEVAKLNGISKRRVEYQLNVATNKIRERLSLMYG